MKKLFILVESIVLAILLGSCTGNGNNQHEPQPSDTLYTPERAMQIYAYEPERALVIIDSALIIGNIDEDLAQWIMQITQKKRFLRLLWVKKSFF